MIKFVLILCCLEISIFAYGSEKEIISRAQEHQEYQDSTIISPVFYLEDKKLIPSN